MKKIIFKSLKKQTLCEFLKDNLTRKFFRNLSNLDKVFFINGQESKLNNFVNVNDQIEINYQEKKLSTNWKTINKKLNIYYEDDDFLVVYKNKNILTIPTQKEPISLYQMILKYYETKNINCSISFLNRLDKKTQGLLLIGKDRYLTSLLSPIKEKIKRRYLCLASGYKEKDYIIINKPLNKLDYIKRVVSDDGKESITIIKKIYDNNKYQILDIELLTGRTHQIRCHLEYINTHIIGDNLYLNQNDGNTMYLISYYLSFNHPNKGIITIDLFNKTYKYLKGKIYSLNKKST